MATCGFIRSSSSVADTPLEPLTIGGERYHWHSVHALEGLDQIDLVLDDGPPRYLGRMLRYASLPTLAPRLSSRAVFERLSSAMMAQDPHEANA